MENHLQLTLKCLFVLNIFIFPATAFAYIGPGAGVSTIGSLLTLLSAILFAIFGFLWYPIKRFKQKLMNKKTKEQTSEKE